MLIFTIPLALLIFFIATLSRAIRKSMKLKVEKGTTQVASTTSPGTTEATGENEVEKAPKDKARNRLTQSLRLIPAVVKLRM